MQVRCPYWYYDIIYVQWKLLPFKNRMYLDVFNAYQSFIAKILVSISLSVCEWSGQGAGLD